MDPTLPPSRIEKESVAHPQELTERQMRELEYHRVHAREHESLLQEPFDWDVVFSKSRRWWNGYWQMFDYFNTLDLKGKKVLIVGCGFGEDAIRIARLGADVYAFDLSPESLDIARRLSMREQVQAQFTQMSAESLLYADNFFDVVLARDILHHVDIPKAMNEISRVSKKNALIIINELYSHSLTEKIRYSNLVANSIYPAMRKFIYGTDKPYITEDERKLTEIDVAEIKKPLSDLVMQKYFSLIVTRVIPDRFITFAKIDRVLLMLLKPVGMYFAGRVMFAGHLDK